MSLLSSGAGPARGAQLGCHCHFLDGLQKEWWTTEKTEEGDERRGRRQAGSPKVFVCCFFFLKFRGIGI